MTGNRVKGRARDGAYPLRTTDTVAGVVVIEEIRTAIFDLHAGSAGTTRLRQRLNDAVGAFTGSEVRITVQYVGPLSVIAALSYRATITGIRTPCTTAVLTEPSSIPAKPPRP
ncbi:hypothetical protein [Mycolicibacterium sarraceniae]|uniref:Uncharacterized protein n=1 Tax=Mycolicibacterium sarraceniae TaxID=1534348 RepID=A0A7I7SZB8_9MYCO|nr:hypothetical protein [Mycolicibacterium sarraceniae]BBY61651.1 hypothetical protein MSAR_47870 [Mycolicibacterium sarraceniae]